MAKSTSNKDAFSPIYVISGKDRRQAIDQLNALVDKIVGDDDPQCCLSQFNASVEIASVLDELKTVPFLSSYRLVVIKDAGDFIKNYRSQLETYVQSPSETGILILLPDSFPSNTKLAKSVAKIGQIIQCDPVKPKDLPAYLANYAKQTYKLTLKRDVALYLIETCGDDAGQLVNEVDKMAIYVQSEGASSDEITVGQVEILAGQSRQFNVFNVIDAMVHEDTAVALKRLDLMFSQDKEAPYTAIGAFTWHFRRLYQAKVMMDQGQSSQMIIKSLRIWSNQEKFISQLKRLRLIDLADILTYFADSDLQTKVSAVEVKMVLEKLIISQKNIKRYVA